MPKPHHNLDVWKESIELVKLIYKITKAFPSDERFGLVSQMRRAAVSIPSNIAEGAARNSKKEFNKFLNIAQGSASELETQIIISRELTLIDTRVSDDLINKLDHVSKMIIGLQRSLSKNRE